MDLVSSNAYWRLQNGLIRTYPTLTQDISCEAVVVGGGISGALLLDKLTSAGIQTILVERYDLASGSTSGSTGLLQYEIDTELHDLIARLGREKGERAYWSCHEAIDKLEELSRELEIGQAFLRKESLYTATQESHLPRLMKEFEARERAGFDVRYLSRKEIESMFSFSREGAILSKQAAEVDPYLLTHRLIARAFQKGARIFDRTCVETLECKQGSPQSPAETHLRTDKGFTIRAKHVICATGYEAAKYLPKGIVNLNTSFALTTKPIDQFKKWPGCCLIWETARPYTYTRTTRDHRIIIGGEDEDFQDPEWRDRVLPEKAKVLWSKLQKMFPDMQLEFGYRWAGTFGETDDGLPYIGTIEKYPGVYFSCGYGGNGITYSSVAADIISDAIQGREHRDANLFSFERFK